MSNSTETDDGPGWRYPFRLGLGTYLLGGGLLYYGRGTLVLLVVLFGYLARFVEGGDQVEVPSFDDWPRLLEDGARVFGVFLVYLVALPLLVIVIGQFGLLSGEIVGEFFPVVGNVVLAIVRGTAKGEISLGSGGGLLINSVKVGERTYSLTSAEPVVLFAVLAYAYPAAVVLVTRERSFWTAFNYGKLKDVLKGPRYAIRWVVFVSLTGLALFCLFRVGQFGDLVLETVYGQIVSSYLLSNEAAELVVFLTAMFSFQLLVVAHYALGVDGSPRIVRRVSSYVGGYDTTVTRLSLGGLLLSLGILPSLVLVVGYLSRTLDHAVAGKGERPELGDWTDLLVRGARATAVWFALVTLPWTVLVFGQHREVLTTEIAQDSTKGALANAIVGLSASPIGPPVGYVFDRFVSDVAVRLGIKLETLPYGLGDPTQIPPAVAASFLLGTLFAWVVFVLVLSARVLGRIRGTGHVETAFWLLTLPNRRDIRRYWGAVGRTLCWSLAGGAPLMGWYVWRRAVDEGQSEQLPLVLGGLGIEIPAPNVLSFTSVVFLFGASILNFYVLVRAYRSLGTALRGLLDQ